MKKIFIVSIAILIIGVGFYVWKNNTRVSQKTLDIPIVTSESNQQNNQTSSQVSDDLISKQQNSTALPQVIIYKTKTDYQKFVSVVLSPDKTKIIAYPAPSDVVNQYPVALHNGYFLGKMPGAGSPDGAFLNLTIAQYSRMLASSITPNQLYSLILDKDPFIEIYRCGGPENSIDVINSWIDSKVIYSCMKLK